MWVNLLFLFWTIKTKKNPEILEKCLLQNAEDVVIFKASENGFD